MLFSFVPGKLVPVPPLTDIFCFAPRNQAPSRSMLVWHFRRADTADPVKGLSEGIWRSQNKHWTWPRSQVPHDTLHICTLLESTLWWCCFHIHQWNGQGTETPKHFNCCTGHRPRTEFSNSGVADDMDNVGPVSLDFQMSCSLWGSDNKSQSQTADHQPQSLEQSAFWLSVLRSRCWTQSPCRPRQWEINSLLYVKHSEIIL